MGPLQLGAILPRAPHKPSPEPRAALPLTAPRRFPRPRDSDRASFPSPSCRSSSRLRSPLFSFSSRPRRHRPPGRYRGGGRGRRRPPLPPHGAWSRRPRAGLPLGCRAPWSRPPPLPCWIARPPGPGRSWKFRGGSDRERPRRGAAPARRYRCPAPLSRPPPSPHPPRRPSSPPSFSGPAREAPRCGCCEAPAAAAAEEEGEEGAAGAIGRRAARAAPGRPRP